MTPTLLELAGASTAGMDGRSLVPLLRGEHPAWRRSLRVAIDDARAVVRKRRKTVRRGGRVTTYDLERDPFEMGRRGDGTRGLPDRTATGAVTPRASRRTSCG